jgi:hypothetical protein
MLSFNQIIKSRTVWFSVVLVAVSVAQGVGMLAASVTIQMLVGIAAAVALVTLRVINLPPLSEK